MVGIQPAQAALHYIQGVSATKRELEEAEVERGGHDITPPPGATEGLHAASSLTEPLSPSISWGGDNDKTNSTAGGETGATET